MNEVWKPIPGYEDRYEISSLGVVRIIARIGTRTSSSGRVYKYSGKGRVMSPYINVYGYSQVNLANKTGKRPFVVHRLVAMTFIPNPQQKATVNHIDGNKLNNHVDNLEWATWSENNEHAKITGLRDTAGENNVFAKLNREQVLEIRRLKKTGVLIKDLALKYNVCSCSVSNIIHGRTWNSLKEAPNQ